MWFDAEANFERFSHKDSIDYYLEKIKSVGFTHAIAVSYTHLFTVGSCDHVTGS